MVEIRVERSDRRSIGMTIKNENLVVVRAPLRMSKYEIERFIHAHQGWLQSHLAKMHAQKAKAESMTIDDARIEALKKKAKEVIPPKAAFWARKLGVNYGRISIRCQKSKWGSCSAKGDLNFNCLLMLCPEACIDYVVIHELCHRKEMNHSARFYAYVESVMPNWRQARAWLKNDGQALIAARFNEED